MSTDMPTRLPLLPLRDVVLFPGISLPLFVGRPRSVAAVDEAMQAGQLFVAVTQKRPELIEPKGKDLYRVGTIAVIREHNALPDGTIRVVASGVCRVRLRRLFPNGAAYRGALDGLPDVDPDVSVTPVVELRDEVLSMFREYVSLRQRVPEDVYHTALKLSDPAAFSFFVAGHLAIGVGRRQALLEQEGWAPRLQSLVALLGEELKDLRVARSLRRVEESAPAAATSARKRSRRKHDDDDDDLSEIREAVERADFPEGVRAKAERELNRLSKMNGMSPEATVSRTYLDWLVSLPWTARSEDQLDLATAERLLDEDHYGLKRVKDRILEHIAVLKLSKTMRGPVLCLLGPPGVGKTSLGRAIARALGRKFVRMSLGGVRDEAEIRGHRRTYIGSMPGRIIQGMRRAGTVNPVILLDEIDKMGSDFRGDPAAALLEVFDPEQNSAFQDHYLDVDYDLSQVMFVTTTNSLATIHPALLDRMELLRLPGYLEYEKLTIARDHLLPRQREHCGLSTDDLRVTDAAIEAIIRERTREAGVRNLEREIATLCRKAARRQAATADDTPLEIDRADIADILGAPHYTSNEIIVNDRIGVATGLAWTEAGGEVLNVEVALLPGKGRLILTGKLGETMQESGQAALSYIRSRYAHFGLEATFIESVDIHIHLAQGGVPKDGPSAGITMALAVVSALTGTPTNPTVALTGEITLRGRVLPVGGLGEKLMGARRAGIRTIIVPEENLPQLSELPKKLTDGLALVPVRNMDEVIEYGLGAVMSVLSEADESATLPAAHVCRPAA